MYCYSVCVNKLLIEVSVDEFNRLHNFLKLNKMSFELIKDDDKAIRTNVILLIG